METIIQYPTEKSQRLDIAFNGQRSHPPFFKYFAYG